MMGLAALLMWFGSIGAWFLLNAMKCCFPWATPFPLCVLSPQSTPHYHHLTKHVHLFTIEILAQKYGVQTAHNLIYKCQNLLKKLEANGFKDTSGSWGSVWICPGYGTADQIFTLVELLRTLWESTNVVHVYRAEGIGLDLILLHIKSW